MDAAGVDDCGNVFESPNELWERAADAQWYIKVGSCPGKHGAARHWAGPSTSYGLLPRCPPPGGRLLGPAGSERERRAGRVRAFERDGCA